MTGEREALVKLARAANEVRARLPQDSPWREACEVIAEEAGASAEFHLPAETPDCGQRRRLGRRG